ncbi:toxin-antitoxin system HicB family antitoxin [Salinisphaera sp. P385]|uniref:Toxin-antitoxin system HicB family antitoxin n=1 Tax=Spectribacter acetivorans TaxID=3075603 RepID=A0ABU3BBQ0_9GAMM|nr:toxin-antitoxin system HicB family antitoxin [Salinisphaera sp. P385]MDT0619914.1 toxin-antitoxin system HicB family antitoxin [Salinisphaera sp. P385]
MFDPNRYTITVRKGDFDGETCFEATVRELPDVAEYGDTFDEAYALAVDTIATTRDALAAMDRCMPAPYVPAESFSGRVTLRLPRSLHRTLYATADAEGVSLNQQIVNVLSYWSGYAAGPAHPVETASGWQVQAKADNRPQNHHLKIVSRNDYPEQTVNEAACC